MGPVLAIVDDLFFSAKLQETASQTGAQLVTLCAAEFQPDRVRAQKPGLIVVDLNANSGRPLETVRQLKRDEALKTIPVVAFLSHVQTDLKRAAEEAGCDRVLARSRFSAELPGILTSLT